MAHVHGDNTMVILKKIMKQRPNDYGDTHPLIVLSVGCGSHPNVEQSYNKPDGRVVTQMSYNLNSLGQI